MLYLIQQSSLRKHTNFKRQKLILRRRSTVEASEQTTSQEQTASQEHTEGFIRMILLNYTCLLSYVSQ